MSALSNRPLHRNRQAKSIGWESCGPAGTGDYSTDNDDDEEAGGNSRPAVDDQNPKTTIGVDDDPAGEPDIVDIWDLTPHVLILHRDISCHSLFVHSAVALSISLEYIDAMRVTEKKI